MLTVVIIIMIVFCGINIVLGVKYILNPAINRFNKKYKRLEKESLINELITLKQELKQLKGE